jgi:uncharacterized protein YyaL (SSP411 family)
VVTGERPDLVGAALRPFGPTTVVSWGEPLPGPLWEGRTETGADGRAYVCHDFTCRAPTTDPQELTAALTAPR